MKTVVQPAEAVFWVGKKRHAVKVGDTVTITTSPGVWRVLGFFGRAEPMYGHSDRPPLIADLTRVDKQWTGKTSVYVTFLRSHDTTQQEQRP